jgi:hypothetical protein
MKGLSPEDVWAVLSDGETYGYWVVGTRGVREVSGDWPTPGSALHYVVGHLPFRKDDITTSVASDPGRRLQLEAHAWPVGTLHIEIQLHPSPDGTTAVIEEAPKKGLLKTLHNPLIDLAIKARNVETLRRLEKQAHQRSRQPRPQAATKS